MRMIGPYRLERRVTPTLLGSIVSMSIAIVLAIAASAVLLLVVDVNVYDAFEALVIGAFGDTDAIIGTLVKAVPLALAGLATGIAFRAKIWNIGQEGQVFAGAMMAYWVTTFIEFPYVLNVIIVFLAGFAGGAALGAFSGFLKARYGVDEIVSTVMMNYIVLFVLSYLLTSRLWTDPAEYYLQTAQIPESGRLPALVGGTDLHVGFLVAVAAVLLVHFVLTRTTFGYEIRAFGSNAEAARFRGTNPSRMFVLVLLISGGLAGLGGASQTFGVDYRIAQNFLIGLGSTGIIVGVIAGMRPLGIGVAAIIFGGLAQGGLFMQVMADVSSAIISAMQGIILIFFLCSSVLSRFRLVRATADV